VALAAGVGIGALVLLALGRDPVAALRIMLGTVLGSRTGLVDTLLQATPLLLIALGYALAFRGRVWTVGGEGQFHAGAIAAAAVALSLPAATPPLAAVPLAILTATAAGVAWALVPGLLRARRDVNEVVSTLMLNFVAILVMQWLIRTSFRDPEIPLMQTPAFPEAFRLPVLGGGRVHAGLALALLLAPAIAWVALRTGFGARVAATGANPYASRVAGIDVPGTVLALFLVSGALGGLAGAVQVLGVTHRLVVGLSHDAGYTAILVALLARNHPVAVVPAALFFSALVVGAEGVQVDLRIPSDFMLVCVGVLVLCVLAADLAGRRREP
jgi:simple sugar transport system permease protein